MPMIQLTAPSGAPADGAGGAGGSIIRYADREGLAKEATGA
ncbi:hypothetical protein [Nonomuraea angiospora]|nr:hypothetical protein [Nonomuraea angiospora]MDX3102641.1 hypothetical protein [Nonomuraea angiospora]